MLKRLRPSIGSAHVIALLALFAALGGGYATAFSGSGTLQKGALDGVSTTYEDLRTLNGFGTLQVLCNTSSDLMGYRIDNTTNNDIHFRFFREANTPLADDGIVPSDAQSSGYESADNSGAVRFHLFKVIDGTKAQVDLVASNYGPFADSCGTADVRVMALNTQE